MILKVCRHVGSVDSVVGVPVHAVVGIDRIVHCPCSGGGDRTSVVPLIGSVGFLGHQVIGGVGLQSDRAPQQDVFELARHASHHRHRDGAAGNVDPSGGLHQPDGVGPAIASDEDSAARTHS